MTDAVGLAQVKRPEATTQLEDIGPGAPVAIGDRRYPDGLDQSHGCGASAAAAVLDRLRSAALSGESQGVWVQSRVYI